jgi:transketolase
MECRTESRLTAEKLLDARRRLLTMHYRAGVGHIGGNLSSLDAMLVIFHDILRGQDRFILSKGHSAGALYVALWSIGRLDDSDLESFHKDGTLLAAHPPSQGIPDIPFATGSLGHGLSLASGTALGMRLQNQDGRVICLTSDGEWQEGSTWEALIFACHHELHNLTILVDHNGLQGFGGTAEVASMSPLWEKLSGFNVELSIVDGHDPLAIAAALRKECVKLHIVILQTTKGNGVSFMADKMEWHYLPLSEAQYLAAVAELGTA